MYVATLVAAEGIDESFLREVAHQFDVDCVAGRLQNVAVIDDECAGDLFFRPADNFTPADSSSLAEAIRDRATAVAQGGYGREIALDVVVQPAADRRKRLLVADMDSTMITIECIDELADYAGIKPQIAEVTERSMRGELDFAAALEARVALLAGLEESAIERCHTERVRLMPGARTLVRTMRAHGATCLLVSGGFTVFADRVAAAIGFDRALANVLEMDGGRLAGRVAHPIVDADAKRRALLDEAAALGLAREATLAVGDGANDIPMIEAAGLGVAYRAKPKTAAAADARIVHGDLHALLWAQGYPRAVWVE